VSAPDLAASVVVPTRDRAAALEGCLRALEGQREVAFEVVVVDDASRDGAAVAAVVAEAPHARLVRGQGRGPAAARNLGAAAARAPVVCFTDDDCRPDPQWLLGLVARIERGASVAAGATVNGLPRDPYASASQTVINHLVDSSFDPARGTVGFAPTCNVAVRADVFARFAFDETFPLAAGEDREWCSRLGSAGIALELAPDAVVAHHQDLSLRRFWRQQVRYGRGALRWRRAAGNEGGRQPVRFYVDLLRAGLTHGVRVGALVALSQVATATGIVLELAASGVPSAGRRPSRRCRARRAQPRWRRRLRGAADEQA
jgi:GT2 family glycosyltransferase